MTDESLLTALADLAKEEPPVDPRLEALALGILTDEELAELNQQAKQDEALKEALLLYAPVTPPAVDRVLEDGRAPSATVIALKRSAPLAGVVLAAAAFLLVPEPTVELVPYTLTVEGGDRATRQTTALTERSLAPGSIISFFLAPDTAVHEPVFAWGFVAQGGQVRPLPVAPTVSDLGPVRLQGDTGTLFPGYTGTLRVILVVGTSEAPPDLDAVRAWAEAPNTADSAGWQVFVQPVTLTSE